MIKRELELVRLNTHTENRVQHAAHRLSSHVFGYGGHVGTYLIVGGVDCKGPQLIEVHADGNAFSSPYHTTGSGSMCAMSVIENRYKDDLDEEEAKDIMIKAIEAGIYYDEGSGSNVDILIMRKGSTQMYRNIKSDNHKMYSKPGGYQFDKARIKIIEEMKHKLVVSHGAQPMEL